MNAGWKTVRTYSGQASMYHVSKIRYLLEVYFDIVLSCHIEAAVKLIKVHFFKWFEATLRLSTVNLI